MGFMRALSVTSFLVLGSVAGGAACGSSGAGPAGAAADSGIQADSGLATMDSGGGTVDSGGAVDSGTQPGDDASEDDSGASTGDGGPTTGFPFPDVISHGGTVLTAPNVVSVTFAGDTLATQLAAFGSSVTSSSYWNTVREGYCIGTTCIGDGPAGTAVALTTAAAASYTDSAQGGASTLQTALSALIMGNQVPAPTADTIYVLYFPATTTISLDGSASCTVFDGYHNEMTLGGQTIVYSVVPECAAPQMTPAITLLQNTTITTSHEIAESSSDGVFTATTGGFYLDETNSASWGWSDVQGGAEIADLCVDQFLLGQDETTENGFTAQRIWSIGNAGAGKNPCVPIPTGEVYFNAFPTTAVVQLDVGQSQTLEVDALADGPMAPWTILPQDWTVSTNNATYLSFSIQGVPPSDAGPPQTQVKSGDKVQVTVTLLADPGSTTNGEADGVIVSANGTQITTTAAHFWPFVVLTPAECMQYHCSKSPTGGDGAFVGRHGARATPRAGGYSRFFALR
jgi:hypothetical protein